MAQLARQILAQRAAHLQRGHLLHTEHFARFRRVLTEHTARGAVLDYTMKKQVRANAAIPGHQKPTRRATRLTDSRARHTPAAELTHESVLD